MNLQKKYDQQTNGQINSYTRFTLLCRIFTKKFYGLS